MGTRGKAPEDVGAGHDPRPRPVREEELDERGRVVVPLAEEQLRVEPREIDAGGVRVRTRVVEHDERIELSGTEESVEVERIPIDRVVDEMPTTRTEGDTLVVPVVEERVFVERRLVLREEIRIVRHVRRLHESRPVRLRREEAEIERIAPERPSAPSRS
jgi:uncharacterized protein (TIGR02271 family)